MNSTPTSASTNTAYALEALRPRIDRMARLYARYANEDPDDLQQEAWLGLLEGLRELDASIGDGRQYLIKRARWRVLDAIKRARLRRCASLENAPADVAQSGDTCQSGRASAKEFQRLLPRYQREVLSCLLRGMTWRETGDQLGCSSANIAYHVRQIRERYRQWESV
jgi:RNA polymerase sigma factor (sigma-70 family)